MCASLTCYSEAFSSPIYPQPHFLPPNSYFPRVSRSNENIYRERCLWRAAGGSPLSINSLSSFCSSSTLVPSSTREQQPPLISRSLFISPSFDPWLSERVNYPGRKRDYYQDNRKINCKMLRFTARCYGNFNNIFIAPRLATRSCTQRQKLHEPRRIR